MGMTLLQNIPEKKAEKESWAFRKLFQALPKLQSAFNNPVSISLLAGVILAGVGEITGRHPSPLMYLTIIIMCGTSALVYLESLRMVPEKKKSKQTIAGAPLEKKS